MWSCLVYAATEVFPRPAEPSADGVYKPSVKVPVSNRRSELWTVDGRHPAPPGVLKTL